MDPMRIVLLNLFRQK